MVEPEHDKSWDVCGDGISMGVSFHTSQKGMRFLGKKTDSGRVVTTSVAMWESRWFPGQRLELLLS